MSDPDSPAYGEVLTVEEIADRFGASPETLAALDEYFAALGASVSFDPTRAYARVDLSVGQAEAAFATTLIVTQVAVDPKTTIEVLRPDGPPTIPAALAGHVEGVIGLVQTLGESDGATGMSAGSLPIPVNQGTPEGCPAGVGTGAYTPNQYVSANGIDELHARGLRGQGRKVAMIEWSSARVEDASVFADCFGLTLPVVSQHVLGDDQALDPSGEATIDVEVLAAVLPELSELELFEMDPGATLEETTATLPELLSAPLDRVRFGGALPDVISSSLGLCTSQAQTAVPEALGLVDHIVAAANAAGVTVTNGAGDTGSTGCTDLYTDQIVQPPDTLWPARRRGSVP